MEANPSMLCSMISISAYHLFSGGRRWIRTIEAKKQQIYSLPPLATRELSPIECATRFLELVDGLEPPTC